MVRYKKKGGKSKAPSKAEFEFFYYDMDESAEEMAERYGVKKTTIYNWATAFRKEEETIGKTDISRRLKVDSIKKKRKAC